MLFKTTHCIYLEEIRRGVFEGKDFSRILSSCPYQSRCSANCPTNEDELKDLEEKHEKSLKAGQSWWIWNNFC